LKHRLLLLNLALAGLTAAGGWRLRQDWVRDHQHTEAVLKEKTKTPPAPALTAQPAPQPFVAPAFADVAQKNLFSKDRNPNVIVEVVAVKPKEPWPPMPVLYGVMGLPTGMVAILAEKPNERSRGVKVGEMIGAMKLVALNNEKLALEFHDETKEQKLEELMDRGGHDPAQASAPSGPQNPANAAAQQHPNTPPPAPKPGVDVGTGIKACDPLEASPAGTVVDGFRLVREQTPFGPVCRWVSGK
jgi:hypothetical protein